MSALPAPRARADGGDVSKLTIDCRAPGTPISPLIYGIAFDARLDAKDQYLWTLSPTARRWGGNTASRYNWRLGNAWNTANDWFFRNVNFTGDEDYSYEKFFEDNERHGARSVLTLPTLGWVAKDTSSYAFSISTLGAQRGRDPHRPDAGDGMTPDGRPLKPLAPTQTSVAAPPSFIAEWVKKIRARDDARGRRSVAQYILDNEPMLWNTTHRDVHPAPVTYDELLERTIAYGTAVRKADPEAVIAGPAEWGWPAYQFSAADAAAGFRLKPDRRAHGDLPLLAWYLKKLKAHEDETGVRIIDVVDVHYYPMADGVGSKRGRTDPRTAALRVRGVRSLWDHDYKDESWIDDRIALLPRLKRWIDEYYPGRGISIGEYNFGAEGHMSGALALAEALGRFARYGVTSAFYWTYPENRSPAYWAFRAYRDFDGKGGRFLDTLLASEAPAETALYASRDSKGDRVVAIALNFKPDAPVSATLDFVGCGAPAAARAFVYTGQPGGFSPLATGTDLTRDGRVVLPPYSISVFDVSLQKGAKNRAEVHAEADAPVARPLQR